MSERLIDNVHERESIRVGISGSSEPGRWEPAPQDSEKRARETAVRTNASF